MDKKELQKAQSIINVLFYDDKALTQWQYELLEDVISIAQTKLRQPGVGGSLPSLDDVTKVAVRISEEAITPPLGAKEQAIFIAGFQECIKWLNVFFGNDH